MLTTGEFTIGKFNIPLKHYGVPVYLIPFGDIHRNSNLCHEGKWKEFLKWAENKKDAYFLGMVDYFDLMSTSERIQFKSGNLHEDTDNTLESMYSDMVRDFYKEISFMKGRLIGLMEGNHYVTFRSGVTSTQKLCELIHGGRIPKH